MIPKVIHYCWFGRNPKPKLVINCLNSWKKHCKGYKIIEWNEDNFDINSNTYVREAYEARKWAFVTDYVRLWVLYNYGGVYMDTDVEVLKPLTPFLEKEHAFSGFEDEVHIPTGIIAAEKKSPIIGTLLAHYNDAHFILPDGTMNVTTNVDTITRYMLTRGFEPNNTYQCIEGFSIYPKDYFCPKECNTGICTLTENSTTIHHFDGSWLTDQQKTNRRNLWKKMARQETKDYIIHIPNRLLLKMLGKEKYEKLKRILKRGN